jgi:hypothetical protein
MIIYLVIDAHHTMIRTLCINVAWCCGEPVSCALKHLFNVYPPPLSDANCPPFPLPGGPGSMASSACMAASISPGSTHIPSILSVTPVFWFLGPTPTYTLLYLCCLGLKRRTLHNRIFIYQLLVK